MEHLLKKGLLLTGIIAVLGSPVAAVEVGDLTIGGFYLGGYAHIDQDNRVAGDNRRTAFEGAVNLDLLWAPHEQWEAFVQLEAGVGNGNVGFAGTGFDAGDLFITFDPQWGNDIGFTLGRYDIPWGEERHTATGNGEAVGNAFVFNSLAYSMFGSPVGWGGTVGLMGEADFGILDVTAAVTNGTSEMADNQDGNLMYTGSAGVNLFDEQLRIAGSYMNSDDRSTSGTSGLAADLTGWIVDGKWSHSDRTYIAGYWGELDFGDDNAATRDDVGIFMGEASYGFGRAHIAARYSGWSPEDDDGSGAGMSATIPQAGLGITRGGVAVVTDQDVRRLQIGAGYQLFDNLLVKAEWFRDSYDRPSGGRSTDVDGIIISANGQF